MKKSYAQFHDQAPMIMRICNKLGDEEKCWLLDLVAQVYDTTSGNVFNPPLTSDRSEIRTQCRLILDGLVDDNDALRFIHKTCCARESVQYVRAYASVPEYIDVLKRYTPLLHKGVTPWYPATIKPVREGWYETNGWLKQNERRRWDGTKWDGLPGVVDEWRGIRQFSYALGENPE